MTWMSFIAFAAHPFPEKFGIELVDAGGLTRIVCGPLDNMLLSRLISFAET